MDKSLDQKLVEDFPLLYSDRYADMRSTCMCWGFPGTGWYQLIRELSEKLEKLIQEYVDKNLIGTCMCGHEWKEHDYWKNAGCCSHVDRLPLYIRPWCRGYRLSDNKFKKFFQNLYYHYTWRLSSLVWTITSWLADHTPLYRYKGCSCVEHHVDHPRASQVKEKFGTLHFYMTCATDEMWDIIHEAEQRSATICENCGKPGKIRRDGWWLTLCDECATKEGRSLEDPEPEEDEEDGEKLTFFSVSFRHKVEATPSGEQKNS